MNREGFTLIEVVLLVFIIGILIVPAFSLLNTMVDMRTRASAMHTEINGVRELVDKIYYEEPVSLLEGVEYRSGKLTLEAVAVESEEVAEERKARERRGENLYEYRRLDIDIRVYVEQELKREMQVYRFGLLTEEEREYYERMKDLHGR